MKRSLHTLEALQASLSGAPDGSDAAAGLEARQAKEAARTRQLAKLSPYRRAEYLCLEAVAELRDALRTIEELEYTLHGTAPSPSGTASSLPAAASREAREAAQSQRDNDDDDDDTSSTSSGATTYGDDGDDGGLNDERAELLGGRGAGGERRRRRGKAPPQRRSGASAVLEGELLRARQHARRAHQRLQQLQRDAARLSKSEHVPTAEDGVEAGVAALSSSGAALGALEWQRAEKHVEAAKRWYREAFGISVVSSLGNPAASSSLQLNRPAQPGQAAGSMAYFGRGANPLPPGVASSVPRGEEDESAGGGVWDTAAADDRNDTSPSLSVQRTLRSAREDDEFRAFFASVQANDELMDAALDRLGEGLSRLLDNARGMQDELTIQTELLQGTETRINENEADLANMNRRLRRAIREMEDSSICVYVVCLMVLLLILGVLLRVAG